MSVEQASTATLRPDVQAHVMEYDAEKAQRLFIGRQVLPVFRSAVDMGEYLVYRSANLLQSPDDTVSEETGYNRVATKVGSKTFTTEPHGLEFVLTDRRARQNARRIDFLAAEANRMWYQILLAHERRVSVLVDTLPAGTAATTDWATIASSDPIGDIQTNADTVCRACGAAQEELTLIVNSTDFRYLQNCAGILDRVKYVNVMVGDLATEAQRQLIATALGVKQVLVGRSAYNTVPKGETASMSAIWPAEKAFLALLVDGEGEPLETPGLGRTVLWSEDSEFPTIETYRDESIRATIERVRFDVDEILQGETSGVFGVEIDTSGS